MRQAKPDDVFQFIAPSESESRWADIEPFLGRTRAFWTWLLAKWRGPGREAG